MKVALLFSGLPRYWDNTYKYYFDNLISKYQVDVYAHFWVENGQKSDFELFYHPKSIKYDTFDLHKECNNLLISPNDLPYQITHSATNMISYFSSLFKCIEMIEDEQYDFTIRARTDFALNLTPDFRSYNPSFIYIPSDYINKGIFGNDQISFQSLFFLKKFKEFKLLFPLAINDSIPFFGENLWNYFFKNSGIGKSSISYINFNHPFPPMGKDIMQHSLIREYSICERIMGFKRIFK